MNVQNIIYLIQNLAPACLSNRRGEQGGSWRVPPTPGASLANYNVWRNHSKNSPKSGCKDKSKLIPPPLKAPQWASQVSPLSDTSVRVYVCLFPPLRLAHVACFLSLLHCQQSHSLIVSVWGCCETGGGRAGQVAAGEATGGSDCHQPPRAEVIFSSRSCSCLLQSCNSVSWPKDSELADYVDSLRRLRMC